MLKAQHKKQIRSWYTNLQQQNPAFTPRAAQAALIAEIAKAISGELNQEQRILLAEAGTGTGKSLAYLLAAVPLAKALNKTLVISTATVALQQQLIEKDLPLVHRAAEGGFSFALAKGRQRYCCQHKLRQTVLSPEHLKPLDLKQAQQLLKQLQAGKWKGDRDSWEQPIRPSLWKKIETDGLSCSSQLSHHRNCPFHKARYGLKNTRVIVTNHSLLLSDLMAGSGHVLPESEQCIYILDEAHQFPDIARDASACRIRLSATHAELDSLKLLDKQLIPLLNNDQLTATSLKLREACVELARGFSKVKDFLNANPQQFGDQHWRFPSGKLPSLLSNFAENNNKEAVKLNNTLDRYVKTLQQAVKDGEIKSQLADTYLSKLNLAQQQVEAWLETFYAYSQNEKQQQYAYWVTKQGPELTLQASLIEIGARLQQIFWEPAFAVVAMSATLSALGRFDFFLHQAGLYQLPSNQMVKLPSPFDYQRVSLCVPDSLSEPDATDYPQQVANFFKQEYATGGGILLLCNSYRLMQQVHDLLPATIKSNVLVQGEQTNQALLRQHHRKINSGNTSAIIATLGFSEGVDLPGDLLTSLLIARLPFAVPSDPVWQSHAELLTQRGLNPFMLLTLPAASRKLIQSCGRLMRKESDSGRILLLDSRLSSRRYGPQLLAALPPFKRSDT